MEARESNMSKARYVNAKIDQDYHRWLRDLSIQRLIAGKDKKQRSIPRLTRALYRHPKRDEIGKNIIDWDFANDDRGQFSVFNLLELMIVGFIAIVFFAGLIYASGLIYGVLHQAGVMNDLNSHQAGYTNITAAADATFGQMDASIQALRLVALSMIFAMALGLILTNFLQKIHPVFFFVYVMIVMLCVFLAPPIANAYMNLEHSNIYGGNLLQSFTGSSWFMENLPTMVTVIGLLGGIFLFINILRTGTEETIR